MLWLPRKERGTNDSKQNKHKQTGNVRRPSSMEPPGTPLQQAASRPEHESRCEPSETGLVRTWVRPADPCRGRQARRDSRSRAAPAPTGRQQGSVEGKRKQTDERASCTQQQAASTQQEACACVSKRVHRIRSDRGSPATRCIGGCETIVSKRRRMHARRPYFVDHLS